VLTLRERSRALEGKLRELVQFGEENDTISDQVHRISLALLGARDLEALLDAIEQSVRDDFHVPATALRIWGAQDAAPRPEFAPVSEEARVFAESLADPYFGQAPLFDTAAWLEGGAAIASTVYVPLRAAGKPLGVIVFGSPDPGRFTADMGTLYLVRLGELLSAALQRHLEA
jgi:uncharacterized protein YigA (DUF484 family)